MELLLVITCSPARSRGFFVMGSHEIPPAQPQSGSDWKRKRKRRSPSKRTRAAICRMKTVSLHIDRIGRVQVDRIASPCRDVQVEEREITNRDDPKAKKDNSYPVFKPTRTSRTSYPKQGIVACSIQLDLQSVTNQPYYYIIIVVAYKSSLQSSRVVAF